MLSTSPRLLSQPVLGLGLSFGVTQPRKPQFKKRTADNTCMPPAGIEPAALLHITNIPFQQRSRRARHDPRDFVRNTTVKEKKKPADHWYMPPAGIEPPGARISTPQNPRQGRTAADVTDIFNFALRDDFQPPNSSESGIQQNTRAPNPEPRTTERRPPDPPTSAFPALQ
ncbi:hypothetical protein B0H17DRAFT_1188711 [Mycena rosella]|uniref:Uncharacterized protein n=1 Tax=Mycena rosella TaxID=1033263 RepID=A0AAD7FG72_MYCRO|nr:hypothetical protein B0H17DRAFT_1188711 [Mycena rosella]